MLDKLDGPPVVPINPLTFPLDRDLTDEEYKSGLAFVDNLVETISEESWRAVNSGNVLGRENQKNRFRVCYELYDLLETRSKAGRERAAFYSNPNSVYEVTLLLLDMLREGVEVCDDPIKHEVCDAIRGMRAATPFLMTDGSQSKVSEYLKSKSPDYLINNGMLDSASLFPAIAPFDKNLFLFETRREIVNSKAQYTPTGLVLDKVPRNGCISSGWNIMFHGRSFGVVSILLSFFEVRLNDGGVSKYGIRTVPPLFYAEALDYGKGKFGTGVAYQEKNDQYAKEQVIKSFIRALGCAAFICRGGPLIVKEQSSLRGKKRTQEQFTNFLHHRGCFRVLVPDEAKVVYNREFHDHATGKPLEFGTNVRGHDRTYRHPRYVNMRGQSRFIQSFWRGPKEFSDDTTKYIVKSACTGDERTPEQIWYGLSEEDNKI